MEVINHTISDPFVSETEIQQIYEDAKTIAAQKIKQRIQARQDRILDASPAISGGIANRKVITKSEYNIVETPLSVDPPRKTKVRKERNFFEVR